MRLRAILLGCGLLAVPASGVYPSPEEDTIFTSVGKFAGASGVAIAPNWVISARHVNGTTFELPGVGTFNVVENYACDFADLRLLKLATNVPSWTPILYEGTSKGKTLQFSEKVTISGFGETGTVRPDGGGYTQGPIDGKRHRTVNMIEGTVTISFQMWPGMTWLTYYVENDNPSTSSGLYGPHGWIPGEGGVGSGDSGGGWFLKRNGKWGLIAVTSSRGAPPGGTVWDYGGVSFGTCLSVLKVRNWVERTMGVRARH